MFPNSKDPYTTPFMPERARAISEIIDLDIVAPISYVPYLKNDLPPITESFDGLAVSHPRYLGMPPFLWFMRGMSYYLMCRSFWHNNRPPVDLVHIEWIYPDAYAFIHYGKKFHMKMIGVIHGNEAIGYFENEKRRRYYMKALQGLDRIIAVSSDLKRKITNEYNISEHKIDVIPNGVDISKFPMMNKTRTRDMVGLPPDKKIGICIARLSEEKNLDILIRAISLLGVDSPLMIVIGDGPLKGKLEVMCESYNIKDKFILKGSIPHNEIYKWLNAADFFCLPSQREGCPVVIHEALACGVPVVATNVGAIPDLIKSEEYGLLCRPSDAQELSKMIARSIVKSWNRECIAQYGRKFTWQSVAQDIVKVFEKVVG